MHMKLWLAVALPCVSAFPVDADEGAPAPFDFAGAEAKRKQEEKAKFFPFSDGKISFVMLSAPSRAGTYGFHSHRMRPDWTLLIEEYAKNTKVFVGVADCGYPSGGQAFCREANYNAFPTLLYGYRNNYVEYNSTRDLVSLQKFANLLEGRHGSPRCSLEGRDECSADELLRIHQHFTTQVHPPTWAEYTQELASRVSRKSEAFVLVTLAAFLDLEWSTAVREYWMDKFPGANRYLLLKRRAVEDKLNEWFGLGLDTSCRR